MLYRSCAHSMATLLGTAVQSNADLCFELMVGDSSDYIQLMFVNHQWDVHSDLQIHSIASVTEKNFKAPSDRK